jgi:predicted nucleic-acid-binding protein
VLDFEIEKQFVNPDKNRLEQLATNTNGKVYYPNQIENLIQSLLDNENYIPTQKETEKQSNTTFSGGFEVLDFEIEKQFVNPDKSRLEQLAINTKGKVFYPNQIENVIQTLIDNENYIPTQKETIKKSPLIDWIWLLLIAVFALTSEWFIRKYNGLL